MFSAEQCRLKAEEARKVARKALLPIERKAWEELAAEWDNMAEMAQAQEVFERRLPKPPG